MTTEGFYSVDSLAGVHVLVVDDEADCRDLLSSILRYCGALVTVASSVDEALRIMKVVKCDVLVADIAMPGRDGYELIRRVRALKPEAGGVVRAIAVSGMAESRHRDEALAAGYEGYLTKPIDPWALCRMVSSLALGDKHGRS